MTRKKKKNNEDEEDIENEKEMSAPVIGGIVAFHMQYALSQVVMKSLRMLSYSRGFFSYGCIMKESKFRFVTHKNRLKKLLGQLQR